MLCNTDLQTCLPVWIRQTDPPPHVSLASYTEHWSFMCTANLSNILSMLIADFLNMFIHSKMSLFETLLFKTNCVNILSRIDIFEILNAFVNWRLLGWFLLFYLFAILYSHKYIHNRSNQIFHDATLIQYIKLLISSYSLWDITLPIHLSIIPTTSLTCSLTPYCYLFIHSKLSLYMF